MPSYCWSVIEKRKSLSLHFPHLAVSYCILHFPRLLSRSARVNGALFIQWISWVAFNIPSYYMANTTSIPPFAKSAPPPPPLIVLLANTDLILDPLPALLSHEDLPLKHSHSHSNRVRFHPYKGEENPYFPFQDFCWLRLSVRTGQELSALSAASMNSRSPLSSASSSPRATPTPESQIPSLKPLATRLGNLQPMTANYYDSDSESSLSSASPTPRTTPAPEPSQTNAHLKHPARSPSSSASTPRATPARETPKPTVRVKKIRKPRPKGAGRESLADIVPLETGLLEKIKVCHDHSCQSHCLTQMSQDDVRKLMHKYLDTSICLSSQDKDKVNIIRKQVCS